MDIRFLVQFADGGRGDFAAPQGLRDVLHTPDGYACQVHLDEGFLHAALPAAVPLNDGGKIPLSIKLLYCFFPLVLFHLMQRAGLFVFY